MQWWVRSHPEFIEISEAAPLAEVNAAALAGFLAAGSELGPFDISESGECFFAGWQRVSHGEILYRMRGEAPFERRRPTWFEEERETLCLQTLKQTALKALDAHLTSLLALGPVAVEASGGIDSGIVLSRLKRLGGDGSAVLGVAAAYPYPEFALEAHYRAALSRHTGVAVHDLAMPALPFDDSDKVEPHEHPAWLSGSWKQTSLVSLRAHELGAQLILTGHGGDRLFLSHPYGAIDSANHDNFLTPRWADRSLSARISAIRKSLRQNYGRKWHVNQLEPGWLVRRASGGAMGPERISGLLSRRFVTEMKKLWAFRDQMPKGGQKPIANYIFGSDLPVEIWNRRGKVDHLGLSYRGAIANGPLLKALVDRHKDLLEAGGIRTKQFAGALEKFSKGNDVGNRFLNGVLSYVFWCEARNKMTAPKDGVFWSIEV